MRPLEVLLIEDSPTDIALTQEGLKVAQFDNKLTVVEDGADALDYLHGRGNFGDRRLPDLVLLDLNIPKVSGFDVLKQIKHNDELKQIPVVVLTTSKDDHDIMHAYREFANCFISKPVDFGKFTDIVRAIDSFWFRTVSLPAR